MPKKNRVSIYEYLFKEGVLVAKKDFTLPKHPEIDVPNLHVIKALTVGNLDEPSLEKTNVVFEHVRQKHSCTSTEDG